MNLMFVSIMFAMLSLRYAKEFVESWGYSYEGP